MTLIDIWIKAGNLLFGELSVSKVNELKSLSSLARAGADGRDFLDI